MVVREFVLQIYFVEELHFDKLSVRDAPDTVFAGYQAGRISG
jgi:hypothetical protein